MSSTGCSSKAAARRMSKAMSSRASPPGEASLPAAPPPSAPEDVSPPESGSLYVERVNDSEALLSYNGDIQDGLIDLLDHIEDDDQVSAEDKEKTGQLLDAVICYVESCAKNSDSDTEMRDTLVSVRATFDDIVSKRDKGSPYQKVINWCGVQRSKKEKQQQRQLKRKEKERDGSA